MNDMILNEFMLLCEASQVMNNIWDVSFILKNGVRSTLTVYDCYSEYDAKERSFLYLNELIYNKN